MKKRDCVKISGKDRGFYSHMDVDTSLSDGIEEGALDRNKKERKRIKTLGASWK